MAARPRTSFWSELVAGWRAVSSRSWYLTNLVSHALWNFAIAAFFVLGPVVAKEHLGGASAWGLIAASLGGGSLIRGPIALPPTPPPPPLAPDPAPAPFPPQIPSPAPPPPPKALIVPPAPGLFGRPLLH